jgi:hypothetical protein
MADDRASINPYKRRNDWHGDAVQDLQVGHQASSAQPKKPSINDILLAGAKRAAKTAKIEKQAKEQRRQQWQQGRTGGRGGRRGLSSSYSYSLCPSYKKIPGTDVRFARCVINRNAGALVFSTRRSFIV